MTFGVTAQGFNPKRLTDIKSEMEADFRAVFGAGIKTSPDTQFGKIIGVYSERETLLWELMEAIYNASYPNSASDISLDRVAEITAISRNPATRSTVTLYLAGTASTLISTGSLFAVQDAEDQFQTTADATLTGSQITISSLTRSGTTVTATSVAHGFAVGRRMFISGAGETDYNGLVTIATVPTADTFTYEIAGTPTSPATGTIVGDPATAVTAEAVNTGPIQALAGTLNVIVNTISGLDRVENQLDAVKGVNLETDAEFRTRRVAALQGLGAARIEAIRGALLQLAGVSNAIVFENATGTTDGSGRPPYSIECLVVGGVNADILQKVWDKKAAGIEPYGSISGTVTDSQGIDHTSKFSRPVAVPIYIEVDLTVNTDFPGISEVENRLLAYGNTLTIGQDVVVFPYIPGAFDDVPGILDIVIRIGTAVSPTLDNNIVITDTEISDWDSSRITVATV